LATIVSQKVTPVTSHVLKMFSSNVNASGKR